MTGPQLGGCDRTAGSITRSVALSSTNRITLCKIFFGGSMAKQPKSQKDKDVIQVTADSEDPLWIYPGERRPVIVQAKNERHAKHKVSESPEYDGFPVYVYSVEKFSARRLPKGGGTKLEDTAEEKKLEEAKKKAKELFLIVKVIGGLTETVSAFTKEETAKSEAEKLAKHLSHESD